MRSVHVTGGMKWSFFKKTALAALVMGFSGAALALPNITILATGGTIAGGGDSATKSNYTAGKVGVENLVNARCRN